MKDQTFCDKCGKQIPANEKFCYHCGAKNVSYGQEGVPVTTEFKIKGISRTKKMAIIGGIILGVFVIIVMASASTQNESSVGKEEPEVARAPKIMTKQLTLIVPSRDDGIETEWKMEPIKNRLESFELLSNQPEGFSEALQVEFKKSEIFIGTTRMVVTLYKYNSIEDAEKSYDHLIQTIRTVGGFTEREIKGVDAKCYGSERLLGSISNPQEELNSYCLKSNIYYHIYAYGWDSNETDKFTNVVANKIAYWSNN